MQPYVITISRQLGSLGRSIAQELSKELDIEFYDRDIVEEVSKRLDLPVSEISQKEEASKSIYFKRQYPLGIGISSVRDEIFSVQKNIIQDLSQKESCIIVGRCADSILQDHPRHLSIYVYAPYMARFKNCTEKLGMDEATAKKMIHEVDISRSLYRKRYCLEAKDDFTNRHIMIDSSRFGVSGSVKIISEIAKSMFL